MDLVEAAEAVRFAVRAGHVLRRQDHQEPGAVRALDRLLADQQPIGEERVRRDQLLREREVVARLALVVRQQVALVPARRVVRDEAEQRREHEVRALPVLLGAAREREVVRLAAVLGPLVERLLEDLLTVGLDDERPAVDPAQRREEVERRDAGGHAWLPFALALASAMASARVGDLRSAASASSRPSASASARRSRAARRSSWRSTPRACPGLGGRRRSRA